MKLKTLLLLPLLALYSVTASAGPFSKVLDYLGLDWRKHSCQPDFQVIERISIVPFGVAADGGPKPTLEFGRTRPPFVTFETKNLSGSDEELRARARAMLEAVGTADDEKASEKKCEAAKLLMEVMSRYPSLNYLPNADAYAVLIPEPEYFVSIAVDVVHVLLDTKSYNQATDFIRSIQNRMEGRPGMDELQYLYAEAYFLRMPEAASLDSTAPQRALEEYSRFAQNFPASRFYAEVSAKVAKIYGWMGQHEVEVGKSYYLMKQYSSAILRLRSQVWDRRNEAGKRDPVSRHFSNDTVAESFYYTCRSYMRLQYKERAQEVVDILKDPKAPFTKTIWRERAERFCGVNVRDPKEDPERKFAKEDKERARERR